MFPTVFVAQWHLRVSGNSPDDLRNVSVLCLNVRRGLFNLKAWVRKCGQQRQFRRLEIRQVSIFPSQGLGFCLKMQHKTDLIQMNTLNLNSQFTRTNFTFPWLTWTLVT